MEKELLELALKRHFTDSSIHSILALNASPLDKEEEGWLSSVTKITLKLLLKNGRVSTRKLIIKYAQCRESQATEFMKNYSAFKIETLMYKTILKEMEYLIEEFEDTNGVLWCNLVHHIPYSCLVLEDLKASGFERKSLLNLDSSLLAVYSLGRYHGMCKKLEERGMISKDDYKVWYVFSDKIQQKSWFLNTNVLKGAVKSHWDSSWHPIVDKIEFKNAEAFQEKLKKLGEVDETRFNLLNHGDVHRKNILLKHDWEGKPLELRFIDFQIPHYGSPCCDLTYLVYLSVDPFVRREHFHQLVEAYYTSLLRSLDQFQYNGKRPTLEEIQEDMEKYSFFGLCMALFAFPSMFLFEEKIPLLSCLKTDTEETISTEQYASKSFKKFLSPDLASFVERFF